MRLKKPDASDAPARPLDAVVRPEGLLAVRHRRDVIGRLTLVLRREGGVRGRVPVLRHHHALELLDHRVHQREDLGPARHLQGPARHEIHLQVDHEEAVLLGRFEAQVVAFERRRARLRGDARLREGQDSGGDLRGSHLRDRGRPVRYGARTRIITCVTTGSAREIRATRETDDYEALSRA